MDKYDYSKAHGQFSNRELVEAAGQKGDLNDLAEAIHEAKLTVAKASSDVQIEDLVGLLRLEANRMELTYIRACERLEDDIENMSEEEMVDRYIERLKEEE